LYAVQERLGFAAADELSPENVRRAKVAF
jgi:hypothetical protein